MKKLNLVGLFATVAALCLSALQAQAIPLQFNVTGDYTASWQLDSDPTPSSAIPGELFRMDYVPGTFGGVATTAYTIQFYSTSSSGGLLIDLNTGPVTWSVSGSQVFTGPTDAPSFAPGRYSFSNNGQPAQYTLTIREITEPSQVPEPASLALVLGGLCFLACSRGKRRSAG